MSTSRRGFLRAGSMAGVTLLLTGGLSQKAFGQKGILPKVPESTDGLALLTQKHFDENIYSLFSFYVEKYEWLEFQLVEVQNLTLRSSQTDKLDSKGDDSDQTSGKECFSLVFQSLKDFSLPQGSYKMKHERLGEFQLFVVPLSAESMRYVAIINRQN